MDHEREWTIAHEPKSFVDTYEHLMGSLKDHALHKTNDSVARFLHEVRHEAAVDMLSEALRAHQRKNSDHAWYFLVEAANAIGYLIASQEAVYPREGEADLRSSLRESGSRGGKKKGENAKKIEDAIVAKLRSAKPPKRGWDKAALRREYNKAIENFDNYNDPDRKWRALCKREDIQNILAQEEP
ncbi:hypothetical protein [Luteibacter sp.]|jgi:hypothetical protein|uniref:hypothetical protein n=1 Tax=Luteibacter sp. TaxID=1886636 RepID=UPI002F3E2A33